MISAKKHGVSLITVLLFMMVATIAATAVYKWLNSEDKSSAARLKQSEAYQASQAGINAARSWLAFNGAETASLVSQFVAKDDGYAISLDSLITPLQGSFRQKFSVVLSDVDVSTPSNIKLKIISTGEGRDNSVYSQVAILNVKGLYQVPIPVVRHAEANFKEAFFGVMGEGMALNISEAIINGDFTMGGNEFGVENYLVVTGNLKVDNIHNPSINGDLYVKGSISQREGIAADNLYTGELYTPSGTVSINNNLCLEKGIDLTRDQSLKLNAGNIYVIDGDMKMPWGIDKYYTGTNINILHDLMIKNGSMVFPTSNTPPPQYSFKVNGDAYIQNGFNSDGYHVNIWGRNIDYAKSVSFGNSSANKVNIGSEYSKISGTTDLYTTLDGISYNINAQNGYPNPEILFQQIATSTTSLEYSSANCDALEDKYGSKITTENTGTGCGTTPHVPDPIQFNTDLLSNPKMHSSSQKGACSEGFNNLWGGQTGVYRELSECYKQAKEKGELYDNEWLLITLSGSRPQIDLDAHLVGKFIIVSEISFSGATRGWILPSTDPMPSGEDSYAFFYFPKNYPANIQTSGTSGSYNYFIYSKADLTSNSARDPAISGSIFMADCSTFRNSGHNYLSAKYNEEFTTLLTGSAVICNNDGSNKCSANAPGSSGSSSGSAGSGAASDDDHDSQWISYGPRLKISLASEYANTEDITYRSHDSSLVVMPRVNYLTLSQTLADKYTVLYLGGLKRPDGRDHGGTAVCYVGRNVGEGTSISETSLFTSTGLHACRYTENQQGKEYTSDFWVWVVDESTTTVVHFDDLLGEFECEDNGETRDVPLIIEGSHGGSLKLLVHNTTSGISLTRNETYLPSAPTTMDNGLLYTLTIPDGVSNIPNLFTMTMNACGNVTGFVQFQLLDEDYSDNITLGNPNNKLFVFEGMDPNVEHRELAEDPNAPDSLKNIPGCADEEAHTAMWGAITDLGSCDARFMQDNFTGPWICPITGKVTMTASGYDRDLCEVIQANRPTVKGGDNTTYAYASLKAKQFTLTINIDGQKGYVDRKDGENFEFKFDDDEKSTIVVISGDGTIVGTCQTGGRGTCSYTVYGGESYHLQARGSNFTPPWKVTCGGNTCSKTQYYYEKGSDRDIVVKIKENTNVKANFNKTGYCFTENFKRLYSYCDHDVTPLAYAGVSDPAEIVAARHGGWINGNTSTNSKVKNIRGSKIVNQFTGKSYNDFVNGSDFNARNFTIQDYGRGPLPNGDTAFCIDQCVTTKNYRVTGQNNTATGLSNSMHLYPIICSAEGNPNIPVDMPVSEKESQSNDYWSYWDPGPRERPSNASKSTHYICAKSTSTPCIPEKDANQCINTSCVGPEDLDEPRIRGGYYPQNDPYSPWIRVLGKHASQTLKEGPIRDDINDGRNWNTMPFIARDVDGVSYMTAAHESTVPVVTLRKEKAGYNGTYKKTFSITETYASYSWGSGNILIFRSNPTATSYYHVAVIGGDQIEKHKNQTVGTNTNVSHILVCYCTNETCPAYDPYDPENGSGTYSPGWGSGVNLNSVYRWKGGVGAYIDPWIVSQDGGADVLGHCTTEPVTTNINFKELVGRRLELTVDMEGDTAHIQLAYESDQRELELEDGKHTISSYMIYTEYTFNLNDPALFGFTGGEYDKYPERTPMYKFKHNVNGAQDSAQYVGFSMHSRFEKIYGLEWRSGGNCDDSLEMNPEIYCGFEDPAVPVDSAVEPVHYVKNYCPNGADCECDFYYTFEGNKYYGKLTFRDVKRYELGNLGIVANCRVKEPGINGATREPSGPIYGACDAFMTFDRYHENKCTDTYNIFIDPYLSNTKNSLFAYLDLAKSSISAVDSTYSYADQSAIVDVIPNQYIDEETLVEVASGQKGTACVTGDCGYAKNWYLNDIYANEKYGQGLCLNLNGYDGINHVANAETHRKLCGLAYKGGSSKTYPKLLKLGFNASGAWHYPDPTKDWNKKESGVDTLYIQVKDSLTGLPFLNLRGATLQFDLLQSWNMDTIQYWLEDRDGNTSPVTNIEDVNYGKTTIAISEYGGSGTSFDPFYVPLSDDGLSQGIPAECYETIRPNAAMNPNTCASFEGNDGLYYDCCQKGLVWWRDANGDSLNRHQSTPALNTEWYIFQKPNFNPERVKRIYFRIVNRNVAGETDIRSNPPAGNASASAGAAFFHIGNVIADCPNGYYLRNCQVNGVNKFKSTDPLHLFIGSELQFSAGTQNCERATLTGGGFDEFDPHPVCTADTIFTRKIKIDNSFEGLEKISLETSSKLATFGGLSCDQYIYVHPVTFDCDYASEGGAHNQDLLFVNDGQDQTKLSLWAKFSTGEDIINTDLQASVYTPSGKFLWNKNLRNTDGTAEWNNISLSSLVGANNMMTGDYELRYGYGAASATKPHTAVACRQHVEYQDAAEIKSCSIELPEGKTSFGQGTQGENRSFVIRGKTNAHYNTQCSMTITPSSIAPITNCGTWIDNSSVDADGYRDFVYTYKINSDKATEATTYSVNLSIKGSSPISCGTFEVTGATSSCPEDGKTFVYVADGLQGDNLPRFTPSFENYNYDKLSMAIYDNNHTNIGYSMVKDRNDKAWTFTPKSYSNSGEYTLRSALNINGNAANKGYDVTNEECKQNVIVAKPTASCKFLLADGTLSSKFKVSLGNGAGTTEDPLTNTVKISGTTNHHKGGSACYISVVNINNRTDSVKVADCNNDIVNVAEFGSGAVSNTFVKQFNNYRKRPGTYEVKVDFKDTWNNIVDDGFKCGELEIPDVDFRCDFREGTSTALDGSERTFDVQSTNYATDGAKDADGNELYRTHYAIYGPDGKLVNSKNATTVDFTLGGSQSTKSQTTTFVPTAPGVYTVRYGTGIPTDVGGENAFTNEACRIEIEDLNFSCVIPKEYEQLSLGGGAAYKNKLRVMLSTNSRSLALNTMRGDATCKLHYTKTDKSIANEECSGSFSYDEASKLYTRILERDYLKVEDSYDVSVNIINTKIGMDHAIDCVKESDGTKQYRVMPVEWVCGENPDVDFVNDTKSTKPKISATFTNYINNSHNASLYGPVEWRANITSLNAGAGNKVVTREYDPITNGGSGNYVIHYGVGAWSATNPHILETNCVQKVNVVPPKITSCTVSATKTGQGSKVTISGTTNAHRDTPNRYITFENMTKTGNKGTYSLKDQFNITNVAENENTFSYTWTVPTDNEWATDTYRIKFSFNGFDAGACEDNVQVWSKNIVTSLDSYLYNGTYKYCNNASLAGKYLLVRSTFGNPASTNAMTRVSNSWSVSSYSNQFLIQLSGETTVTLPNKDASLEVLRCGDGQWSGSTFTFK